MLQFEPADLATVSASPLFSGLPRDVVLHLLEGARVLSFPESGLLFSEGDAADRFFCVLAGRVDLFALTAEGNESVIEVFDVGWTFAEAAMFASGRFPLNAQAAAGTRLLVVPKEPFLGRVLSDPGIAFKILSALTRWHDHLMHEIDALKRLSPAQRLGAYLLQLVGAEAAGSAGGAQVQLPLTKSLLASRLGVTPESLSRVLARLRKVGVQSKGRIIEIEDVAALRAFCESSNA